MIHFLSFLSIIGWTGILSKKYPKLISVFPLFVCASIICLLYLSSLMGILFWANKLIFLAGLFFLIYCLGYILIKNRFSPAKTFIFLKEIPIEFWFFLILGTAWYFFTRRVVLLSDDNFYWAKYAKFIFYNHGFSGLYGKLVHYNINYAPSAPLFQNFFLQFNNFSESSLYFARGIMIFSALVPIIATLRKTKISFVLLFIFCFASILSYFLIHGSGFLSLYVDSVMGITFGAALAISFISLKKPTEKLLLLPILFSLTLFKDNGIILSLIIISFNLIDLIIINRAGITKEWKTKGNIFSIFIIIALVPILAFASWRLYLRIENILPNTSTSAIVKSIQQPSFNKQKNIMIHNYLKALVSDGLNYNAFSFPRIKSFLKDRFSIGEKIIKDIELINKNRLTFIEWSVIIIIFCVVILISLSDRREKTRITGLFLTLLGGLILYSIALLIAYLFFFATAEATTLRSMARYLDVYFIGTVMVIFAIVGIVKNNSENLRIKNLFLILFTLCFVLFSVQFPPFHTLFVYPNNRIKRVNDMRTDFEMLSDKIKSNTSDQDKIFADIQFNGIEAPVLQYEVFPRKLNGGWTIKQDESGKDIIVNRLSPEQLKKFLSNKNYQYLIVDRIDDNFWLSHQDLFGDISEAKKYQLFKIERNPFKLIPVQ
ncbi:hypothetical protein COT77_01295 [Candidatus Berkelbacteria bacterium CG10_big_fil_rev_8_21_14_0_10_41_12]|uniref:Glycosyltransferase RgtA/B/C/D-like domain-containing protein n=1 Tax=Candidatus Berkelbacteria bacterium CG10_big_fil_rev_8_21_14_0_10_41_12 TaxID=1974513 RepID=A0A2M6WXD7_9BACT|nr:MAG: hypothetical protein COT77_01295 [Candidatus Berkelbacteria bacterium CG10_big_fil_rev_8_21_14_0_10_41_12]